MSEKDLYIGGTLIKESASFVACVYVFHQHIIGRCRQNLCFGYLFLVSRQNLRFGYLFLVCRQNLCFGYLFLVCRQNLCFHQPILGLQSILQTKNRLDDLRPAVRSRFNRSLGDT